MAGLRFNIYAADKTKKAFQSVKSNVTGLKGKFAGLKKSIGGIGGLIIGAFAGASIRAIIDITDKVQKFALVTGISTEALSELKFAGEQSGVEFDKLQVAIRKTAKSVADANRGLATQVDALTTLGLKSEDLINLPLDEQFQIIGDKLRGVESQSQKVAIAMDLMGRSGSELLAMFDSNADSVAELREELRSLNGVITQEQADALAGLNDAWNRVKTAFQGIVRVVVSALAPAFELLLNIIAELIAFVGKTIRTILLLDDAIAGLIATVGNFFGLIEDGVQDKVLTDLGDKWDSIWDSTHKAKNEVKDYGAELAKIGSIDPTGPGKSKGKGKKPGEEKMTDAEKQAERSMDRIEDVFKDGITSVIKDFDNLGDVVKDTMGRIGDIILQNQMDQIFGGMGGGSGGGGLLGGITDIFSGMLGGGGSSGGGGFMAGAADLFSSFGGFFAKGGNFNSGKPIVVGENGPEVIHPRSGGFVQPNHELGGSPVNVTMNIQTPDANSFRQSQSQIAVSMANQIEVARRRNM